VGRLVVAGGDKGESGLKERGETHRT
jgi:hypothetical protein